MGDLEFTAHNVKPEPRHTLGCLDATGCSFLAATSALVLVVDLACFDPRGITPDLLNPIDGAVFFEDRARMIIASSAFLAKMVFDGVSEKRRQNFVSHVLSYCSDCARNHRISQVGERPSRGSS